MTGAGRAGRGFHAARDVKDDAGAIAVLAFDFDFTAVFADDAADDEQPESGARLLGASERLE